MTDWSGISYEYSLTTLKPTLFVNTPMKVMNPDYGEISVTPMDIEIRNKIGIAIEPVNIRDEISKAVERLLHEDSFSKETMKEYRSRYLYNVGCSARVGADYIINSLIERYRT